MNARPSIRLQLFAQTAETQPGLFDVAPLAAPATAPACPHPLLSWRRQASLFPNTADDFICTACNEPLPRFSATVDASGQRRTLHTTCALDRCDAFRILDERTTETACHACNQK